ncbi:universal stress protein [Streptomyces sp. SLBN-31]|jgi:nucleotide-binding universal stress UspA family protein|uniref:universal stress protein n=1 Tax=Streptomyces sp. SLBN-31 TaxID=2768444 RepID=UPI001154BC5B|nr:universal stress protein [Streptomyces sp. SLBN-31]TQJ85993.1 universal stress protein family protein [Streptomyces sp. SLBN-31]
MAERAVGNSVVVGVDGSEASVAALRWAARQARALHATVVAVHAWQRPGFAPYAPATARPTAAEQRDGAARLLTATLREVFGPQDDDAVRAVVAEGAPARVLVQQAQDAVLLALGRTPHRGHDEHTAGAVVRACLEQATVPVVTVPGNRRSVPAPAAAGTTGHTVAPAPRHGARWTCTVAG